MKRESYGLALYAAAVSVNNNCEQDPTNDQLVDNLDAVFCRLHGQRAATAQQMLGRLGHLVAGMQQKQASALWQAWTPACSKQFKAI